MRSVSPSTDEICPMNEAGISWMGADAGQRKITSKRSTGCGDWGA